MQIKSDTRRINFPMLAKVMGWLLMIEGAFMAVPAIVALCYAESDWRVLAICSAVTAATGFGLNRGLHPRNTKMAKREGFLLTALVWVVFSFFGMLPMIFCATPLSVVNAYCEAMAGFTTTGISLFPSPELISHGINLWRAMMQWIGGMGIILFTLAVLPMLNSAGGMQLFNAEVTGITHEKIRPRISQTAKGLWAVYISLTLICTLLLYAGPMSLFDSICHAFGTISTGGFSTASIGVCDWNSNYIYTVITVFMLLGGTSFSLIFFAAHGNFKPMKSNITWLTYVGIIASATVIISLSIWAHHAETSFAGFTLFPLFQVVSTITSTGYVMPDLKAWGPLAVTLIVPLMCIGGCAGSTAGGAKVDRFVVLSRYMRNSLKRALQPNSITSVKVDGRVLPPELVQKVISFLCLYFVLVCTGAILLAAMDVPFVDSFFSSLSAITNLGVGADVGACGAGIEAVPELGRLVLAALMLIGRLEIITILILFTPNFWHK